MNNIKATVFFVFISLSSFAQSWTNFPNFPGSQRDDGAVFSIGSKFYCGTGFQNGWTATRDLYVFDAATDSWIDTLYLPAGAERQYAAAFSSNSKGYIFGGVGVKPYKDLLCYDPQSEIWTYKMPLPGIGRAGATSFSILDYAYIIGGQDSAGNILDEVWRYDMVNDSWLQLSPFPFGGRGRASGCAVNNKGYLVFGKDDQQQLRNELYEYNPTSDTWTQISAFPGLGRTYSSMVKCENDLAIVFGVDSANTCYRDVNIFDIDSLLWKPVNDLPSNARKGGMCFTYGTNLYYTTGIDQQNNRLNESWKASNICKIEEVEKNSSMHLYPIPANDYLILDGIEEEIHDLQLINYLGQVKKVAFIQDDLDRIEIDTKLATNGMYFLTVMSANSVRTVPITIMH